LPRAVALATELLNKHKNKLSSVELVTSSGGVFEVDLDGERVFSKRDLGRFPEEGEIDGKVADKLAAAAH
jgi:selenoprotein W-related protein